MSRSACCQGSIARRWRCSNGISCAGGSGVRARSGRHRARAPSSTWPSSRCWSCSATIGPPAAPAADGLIASLPPGERADHHSLVGTDVARVAPRGRARACLARERGPSSATAARSASSIARDRGRARRSSSISTRSSPDRKASRRSGRSRAPPLSRGAASPSLRDHLVESDAHASRVCRSLGDGVLSALPALTMALAKKPRRAADRSVAFEQALTIVYRILFLLFAEARSLVPIWNEIYRDAYTIEALTARARLRPASAPESFGVTGSPARRARERACGKAFRRSRASRMQAARPEISKSPRSTAACSRRATRRSSSSAPLPDQVMRDVLLSLASAPSAHGRRRISYHDLGVEQLGSVYERVLEHEPATAGGSIVLARTSTRRKTTGSFYTPQALTEFLVRRTLSPLIEGKTAGQILDLRVVDPAMGSGAFLVAACVFLADACEHALIRDGQWPAAEVGVADRASLAPPGRRAMRLRRRPQSDGGAARAGVAVVDHAGRESPADVSGSPSRDRQQPDWRAAERSVAATGARGPAARLPPCRCSRIRWRRTCPRE